MDHYLTWDNEDEIWVQETLSSRPAKLIYRPYNFHSLVNRVDHYLNQPTNLYSFEVGIENLIIFSPHKLTTCILILCDSYGNYQINYSLETKLVANQWSHFKTKLNVCLNLNYNITKFALTIARSGNTYLEIFMRFSVKIDNQWQKEGF